jgi:brefeldin A-resistance guanine nucleotide exchange factor 1
LFLKNAYGLDRDQIGSYLADPRHALVLKEYTRLFNFKNKPVVDAIREYLSTFTPPSESQIMTRFMEAFS